MQETKEVAMESEPKRIAPVRIEPARIQPIHAGPDASRGEGGSPPSSRVGAPGGAAAPPIRRWKKSTWVGLVAGATLVLAMVFGGGGPKTAAKEDGADKLPPSAPTIGLSMRDLDRSLMRQHQMGRRPGQPAPIPPSVEKVSPSMQTALDSGQANFYSMLFYDTCQEDGDFISVTLDDGTTTKPFMITKAGTVIQVPMVASAPPKITISAIKDGVGGVTVGCRTSDGIWYSRVLREGEEQQVPCIMR
jgi:hypothetical protein